MMQKWMRTGDVFDPWKAACTAADLPNTAATCNEDIDGSTCNDVKNWNGCMFNTAKPLTTDNSNTDLKYNESFTMLRLSIPVKPQAERFGKVYCELMERLPLPIPRKGHEELQEVRRRSLASLLTTVQVVVLTKAIKVLRDANSTCDRFCSSLVKG